MADLHVLFNDFAVLSRPAIIMNWDRAQISTAVDVVGKQQSRLGETEK